MSFGEWFKARRKEARLSLDEVAAKVKFSKSYLNRVERNLAHPTSGALPRPSREFVEAVSVAIGASINEGLRSAGYLPSYGEVVSESAEDEQEVIRYYRGIPASYRPEVKAMVKTFYDIVAKASDGEGQSKEE